MKNFMRFFLHLFLVQLEQQRQQLLAERQQFFMEQTQLAEATAKNMEKSVSQPMAPSAVLTNVSAAASSGTDSTSLQATVSESAGLKATIEKDESNDASAPPASTADIAKPPPTSMAPLFSSAEKVSGKYDLIILKIMIAVFLGQQILTRMMLISF